MATSSEISLLSRKHVACQLARMGDLVQMLPLLDELQASGVLHLICDQAVLDWAELLPCVDQVFPIDTRFWRKTGVDDHLDLQGALVDLQTDLEDIFSLEMERCVPLNDHPLCDKLAAIICEENPQRWLNHRLVKARSYLRSIVSERRWNRVHLSDIWRSLAGESKVAEIPHIAVNAKDRQFARGVLNAHPSMEKRPLVAFILGSGSRHRRVDPEDFSAWWTAIPGENRPGCVLIGGQGEEELGQRFLRAAGSNAKEAINLVGSCSPRGLLGIFTHVDLIVGVDTGPLHWAAATGAKVLGIYFGEAGFHETGPYGDGHLVLAPECSVYPCNHPVAQNCGFRCLQQLKNPKIMADLVMYCVQESSLSIPKLPQGFHFFKSHWMPSGQGYEALVGGENSPEVVTFSNFARRVFNDIQLTDDSQRPSEILAKTDDTDCASQFQFRSIDILIQNWLKAIKDLPMVKTIPMAIAERVKLESIMSLNDQRAKFFAADENESLMRV